MLNIGAVILAAGESSRFGRPKQLIQFRGKSLVRRIADAAGEAGCPEAIALLVCDQPFVDARTIARLIMLREKTKRTIVASSYANTLGVPALFDRSCFQELLALDNATGAKMVILSNRERVAEFPFPEGKIDIDTLADYEKLIGR